MPVVLPLLCTLSLLLSTLSMQPVQAGERHDSVVVFFSLDEQMPSDVDALSAATVPNSSTADAARLVADKTGAVLYRIPPALTYPPLMTDAIEIFKDQMTREFEPPAPENEPKLLGYRTVFLGFPVWLGSLPREFRAFIKRHAGELDDAELRIFATSGMTPPDSAITELQKLLPNHEIGQVLNLKSIGDDFESLTLGIDSNLFAQITEFAKENKFVLLSQEDCALLEQIGGAEIFAQRALASAYSGFSLTGGSDMDTDPFFLADNAITSFAQNIMRAGTSMAMHDDVLAAQYEGKWYVLLRAVLSVEGSALADDESGAARIFNEAARIETQMPGVHFYYSGVAFHSHEASTKASFEVTLISAIAMVLVSALLLFVFRDVRPILCTVGAIIVSCATACCATVGVFGNIHFLTFVFGTTLIGTCNFIDN